MALIPVFAFLFLAGIFFNEHFFWCHWPGFAGLWFLYQKNRQSFFKKFLFPCWLIFFIVYAAYISWMARYQLLEYFISALTLSLIFPLFFVIYHVASQRIHSVILQALTVFVIFYFLEIGLSFIPIAGTVPLDFFFFLPDTLLGIFYFVSFKVWSALLFTACFTAGSLLVTRPKKAIIFLFILLLAFGITAALGHVFIRDRNPQFPVKIALIQHNLPFSEVWRMDHTDEVKRKYEALALDAAGNGPSLMIFPQYTFPGDIYRDPAFFERLARKVNAYILVASRVPAKAGQSILDFGYMNMAFLFSPAGKMEGIYQSVEEAPFGRVRQDSSTKYQVLITPFGKLGILLCYEDVTSRFSKEAKRAGADILVALSNPGMFTDTPMPYYHLRQDQLRAMETGLPLLRVSPNGYSAFIDKSGRITQKSQLNTENILFTEF